jgi:DNA-binding response OmpR family regulator
MPIVDGLTSTKMIRSFEKTHPKHLLSSRAQLNGRVPIIAVSASLVEKERQTYIDAGFDGWILKPVSFPRVNELMAGIVEPKVREEALYKSGEWEKGGWFEMAQPNRTQMENSADTKLDEKKPSEGLDVDTKQRSQDERERRPEQG